MNRERLYENIIKDLNKLFNHSLNEVHGILNSENSGFNKLVKRIAKDTLKYPNFGKEKVDSNFINILSNNYKKYVNSSNDNKEKNIRKYTYINTGLDWISKLPVYWLTKDEVKFSGSFFPKIDSLIINVGNGQFDDNNYEQNLIRYEELIAHELRHAYTFHKDGLEWSDEENNNWKKKETSIQQLEIDIYFHITINDNILKTMNLETDKMRINNIRYKNVISNKKEAFLLLLYSSYYLLKTEMNSYLESFNSTQYSFFDQNGLIAFTKNIEWAMTYDIYRDIYKHFKQIKNNIDTEKLGKMYNCAFGRLSQKVYASKRNRDVRDNDPTDMSIYIDYKLKQLESWLHKANSILIDKLKIAQSKDYVYNLKIVKKENNEYFENIFKFKIDLLNALNFRKILNKLDFEEFSFDIDGLTCEKTINENNSINNENIELLLLSKIKELIISDNNAKMFAEKIKMKGINKHNIIKYMPKLITAWQKYTKYKNKII